MGRMFQEKRRGVFLSKNAMRNKRRGEIISINTYAFPREKFREKHDKGEKSNLLGR
jgi:hypothetical protein